VGGLIPTVVDEEGRACGGAAPPTVGAEFPIAGLVALGAVLLFMLVLGAEVLELFALLDKEQPASNAATVKRAQKAKVLSMCFS
jgi:hypothetical protein